MLLKNDATKTLPLKAGLKIALIGPWGNATVAMQGNYFGTAPFLISPQAGAIAAGYSVTFVQGATISGTDTSGFAAAVAAAQAADVIVYAGGIDDTVEAEGMDRSTITWPGVQSNLITSLTAVGKPLVVVQFGGGQVDNSAIKANAGVSAFLCWADQSLQVLSRRSMRSFGQAIPGRAAGRRCSMCSAGRRPPLGVFRSRSTPRPSLRISQ